jgi:hypothetical protein
MTTKDVVRVYFSDYFGISTDELDSFGALDISLINDLPLFIDPFLLFNSPKPEYQKLHEGMIDYLRYLREISIREAINRGGLYAWFKFSELKQNWLGFSGFGNKGSGLGLDFAQALNSSLYKVFSDFGKEKITHGSHLEKLCLIGSGVGRDNISDFTTNLIKEYLLEYTQKFAQDHLLKHQRKLIRVTRVRFNYTTETWESGEYELPYIFKDFVILTPIDMLTRDDTWINRSDMATDYNGVISSVSDSQLRAQLNNYLSKKLSEKPGKATQKEKKQAVLSLYQEFPEMIDYYIRFKEDNGDSAIKHSGKIVQESKNFYIYQLNEFVEELNRFTDFYKLHGNTYTEARERIMFLKDVVENKGGQRIFYKKGKPIRSEIDLHILYRLTWFGTPSDIGREVNDGRGPVDFKVSRGSPDKTLVEFKLASNPQLEKNLQKQVEIYQKASDAQHALKVIFYFKRQELIRLNTILKRLGLRDSQDIILIDARNDNKPSGSKASSDEALLDALSANSDIDFGDVDLSDIDKFTDN